MTEEKIKEKKEEKKEEKKKGIEGKKKKYRNPLFLYIFSSSPLFLSSSPLFSSSFFFFNPLLYSFLLLLFLFLLRFLMFYRVCRRRYTPLPITSTRGGSIYPLPADNIIFPCTYVVVVDITPSR